MKSTIKLVMIGAVGILAGTAAPAQSAGDDSPSAGEPRGGSEMNRPNREAHHKALLEQYDANKNGKLDDSEFKALGKDVFEGKLPPPPGRGPRGRGEHGQAGFGPPRHGGPDQPDFGSPGMRGPRGEGDFGPRGPQMGGPPGPHDRMMGREFGRGGGPEHFGPPPRFGRPDTEEHREILENYRRELVKKYDANGDGKLDSAEREALGKDVEDGKLQPPPMPPQARRHGRVNDQ